MPYGQAPAGPPGYGPRAPAPQLGTYPVPPRPGASPYPTIHAPTELSWEEGEPIPPGYRLEGRIHKGLLISGLSIFGGPYLFSVVGASSGEEELTPLYIPLAGPFVTIATARSEGAGTFWLAIDGIVQTTGVTLAIIGLAANVEYLQRDDIAQGSWLPEVAVGPTGGDLKWSF